MKWTMLKLTCLASCCVAAPVLEKRSYVYGFDISNYQPSVDFSSAYYDGGLRFVYIKATQGTYYTDPTFSSHYEGATDAGFIRGGYHFAGGDDAIAEADFFVENGGGWSDDGRTLPGMLDLEGDCQSEEWIMEFSNQYHALTGRYPVLYSSPSWWEDCTGNSNAFVNNNPLDMACWDSEPCNPQGDWPYYSFWQYADTNPYGGDSDVFNGDMTQLQKMATG